ncbi:IS3 family transposase [Dechloromonas sp. HYN0024]|nr:IS3 family transposase [Dechloromonas sp. HYN0024]AXS79271.1 IS3 family transposase [Dechloromonas sp. HYN0024]
MKRTQRDYTLTFKRAVVEQVEKGELSCRQAQDRYGIQGKSTVLAWLRKHGRQNWDAMAHYGRMSDPTQSVTSLTPEQRIKELEVQLKEAREKSQFFEAVIDVLKKDYGVRVVKKPVGQVLTQKSVEGLSVSTACRYMGISRQAHYQWQHRRAQDEVKYERVLELVKTKRLRQPRLGTRKLHHLLGPTLAAEGRGLGRDALFDLLRWNRLLVPTKRAYHKTTDSHHRFRRHPNLLKAGPEQICPEASEQVWVADITYLPTRERCAYLSLITDAYSRKIVGYHVHDSLHTAEVSQALKMALKGRRGNQALIHHSDRGIQYCSNEYQAIHRKNGLICSMTDGYDCYQNALAERVNGILKHEFLLQQPSDLNQARHMVSQSIAIYNQERPHLSLQLKTPDEVHRASLQASN